MGLSQSAVHRAPDFSPGGTRNSTPCRAAHGWVVAFAFCTWASRASAHDYWLAPDAGVASPIAVGATVPVRLWVGEALRSDEERDLDPPRTTRFQHLYAAPATDVDLLATSRPHARPVATLAGMTAGGHLLALDRIVAKITLPAGKFEAYLEEEGLGAIVAERRRLGESEKPGRERYSRYLKALLQVGDARDDVATHVVGQALEIVPRTDPAAREPGDTLDVAVRFEGRPLGGAMLLADVATGGGVSSARAVTDAEGVARVTVTRRGAWLLHMVHMRRCAGTSCGDTDWESFWGSYSFSTAAVEPADDLRAAAELQVTDPRRARALATALAESPGGAAEVPETAAQRDVAARAHFVLAEIDEHAREYAAAVAHYRRVLEVDPGNWNATTARTRLGVLEGYAGGFAELARLDEVRKDTKRSSDPAAVEALERDAMAFPPGRARTEALLFVTEAFLGRLHRPARAIAPALTVARAPETDELARSTAFELAYEAARVVGAHVSGTGSEIARDPRAPATLVARIAREVRRVRLHRASMATAVTVGALGVIALGCALLRRRGRVVAAAIGSPHALTFVGVLTAGGFALCEAWGPGQGTHFVAFGLALLGVHVFASSWRGAFGDARRALRAAGGVLAVACVLAAAYLILERGEIAGTPLLEGFGL